MTTFGGRQIDGGYFAHLIAPLVSSERKHGERLWVCLAGMATPKGPVHKERPACGMAALYIFDQNQELAVIGVFNQERNSCKGLGAGKRSGGFEICRFAAHIAVQVMGITFPPPVPVQAVNLVFQFTSGSSFAVSIYADHL